MLLRLLKFLNLLEPNKNIISISKTLMWTMLFVLIYTVINNPENTVAVAGTIMANFISIGNYAFRRWVQFRAGNVQSSAGVSDK